jgi:hypothetical protein
MLHQGTQRQISRDQILSYPHVVVGMGIFGRADLVSRSQTTLPLVRIGEPCPDGPHRHTSSLLQIECDIKREIARAMAALATRAAS